MQQIVITDAKSIKVGDVKEVFAFSDREIKLALGSEKSLLIEGAGLKIGNFTKSNGEFLAEGTIFGVKFANKRESLLKRVFK